MRISYALAAICCILILAQRGNAQSLPVKGIATAVDSTGHLDIEQVSDPRYASRFREGRALAQDFPTWVRIQLPDTLSPGRYCIDFIIPKNVAVYYATDGGRTFERVEVGPTILPSQLSLRGHPMLACFETDTTSRVIYARFDAESISGSMISELTYEPYAATVGKVVQITHAFFVIIGAAALILLISFMLFAVLKDRTFLVFGIFILCFYIQINKVFLAGFFGHLWPELLLDIHINQLFFLIGPLSFLAFAWVYFRVPDCRVEWRYLFISFIPFALVCAVVAFFNIGLSTLMILFFNLGALILITAVAAKKYYLEHWKPASYFLIAMFVPIIAASLIVAQRLHMMVVSSVQLIGNAAMLTFCIILGIGVVQRYRKSSTEQVIREREAELVRQKSEELAELNETKDKLLSVLAHDLRGPVANLSTIISLLSDKAMTAEEFHHISGKLKTDVETAYSMLEEVLHWVKSQREGIVAKPVDFDMVTLVNEVLGNSMAHANAKKIRIIVEKKGSSMVYADRDHMHLVTRNLLGNALKFSPLNSEVRITVTESPEYVSLHIEDQGIGMAESDIQKILQREKVVGTVGTQGEKGTGLGLLLCLEFIEYNKGTFHLTSVKDTGTKAGFTLPKRVSS